MKALFFLLFFGFFSIHVKAEVPSWWIQYGQYEKKWNQWNSKISEKFWIFSKGSSSPEAELQESQKLFQKKNDGRQCDFPYRGKLLLRHGYISHLDLSHCEKMKQWKESIGANGASLIFANADVSTPGSSFGHTFLKLLNPKYMGSKQDLNYSINFAASTENENGAMVALKGLLGFYRGYFSMLPFHQKIREYQNLEGRDVYEFKLNLSPEEVDNLVDLVLDYEKNSFQYLFHSKNCSYQILNLLQIVRPSKDIHLFQLSSEVIPEETVFWIFKNNFISDERWIPSLNQEWKNRLHELNNADIRIAKSLLSENTLPRELSELDKARQRAIIDFVMSYQAYLDYQNGNYSSEKQFLWQSYRSKLGYTYRKPIEEKKFHFHDTSSWSASIASNSTLELEWQRSHHSLLHSSDGQWSKLSILAPRLNYDFLSKKVRTHFTLFDVQNYKPINSFERPLSWEFKFGVGESIDTKMGLGAGISVLDNFDLYLVTGVMSEKLEKEQVLFYSTFINLIEIDSNYYSKIAYEIKYNKWQKLNSELDIGINKKINMNQNIFLNILFQSAGFESWGSEPQLALKYSWQN